MADPTRRKILRMLGDGELSAGQIGDALPISPASMSHHFNVLKQAGLISGRREGQQILYSVNTTVMQELAALVLDLIQRPDASPMEITE